jgi:hypothetical protein
MHGKSSRVSGRQSLYLLSGILAAAALPVARAAAQTAVNTNDVYLSQVEYSDDAGTDISPNGQLLINTGDASLSGGYINVANSSGTWIVQNMPVVAGMPDEAAEFPLGTADGTNDTGQGMSLSVDVSSSPLISFTPTAPTSVTVSGEDVEDDEGEGAAANPSPVSASNLSFSINGQNRIAVDLGVPNVQAANNQCAPAAIANALAWLKANKGLNIPDPNVPGRGALAGTLKNPSAPTGATYATNTLLVPNGGANTSAFAGGVATYQTSETTGDSLVGQLDLTMQRTSQNRARFYNATGQNTNAGVNGQPQVVGTELYLGSVGDAPVVKIDTQGNVVSATNGGITSNNLNAAGSTNVTANFLYNELSAGAAVKVGYTGHATDLIATGSILGQPWVFLQSDLAQTPQNDSLDQKLNLLANLPAGLSNASSIPEFSYLNETAQTFPGLGVSVLNAIAISVVPEPSAVALVFGIGAILLVRPRRRAAV